jgi:hypothetical protein
MGVRGVLVHCADYRCSHSIAISADRWPDDLRLSDIEDRFTCSACGKRGADVRPIGAAGQFDGLPLKSRRLIWPTLDASLLLGAQ